VRERSVADHVHLLGGDTEHVDEPAATVLGVDDDRGNAIVELPLRPGLTRACLAWEQIVGRQHDRPGREQVAVEPLQREPLEVDDIGAPRQPAVARHVRDVPQRLGDPPRA
jgi:hypothetical protein